MTEADGSMSVHATPVRTSGPATGSGVALDQAKGRVKLKGEGRGDDGVSRYNWRETLVKRRRSLSLKEQDVKREVAASICVEGWPKTYYVGDPVTRRRACVEFK